MLNITRINQNSGAIKYPEVCIFLLSKTVTETQDAIPKQVIKRIGNFSVLIILSIFEKFGISLLLIFL